MGRLRSRLSSHQADRDASRQLADSDRCLRNALEVYAAVLRSGSEREKKRASRAMRDIKRAMGILSGVQSVGTRFDLSDPDLVPEAEKSAVSRRSKSNSERGR